MPSGEQLAAESSCRHAASIDLHQRADSNLCEMNWRSNPTYCRQDLESHTPIRQWDTIQFEPESVYHCGSQSYMHSWDQSHHHQIHLLTFLLEHSAAVASLRMAMCAAGDLKSHSRPERTPKSASMVQPTVPLRQRMAFCAQAHSRPEM